MATKAQKVDLRSVCNYSDGPQVNNSRNTKIQGKHIEFAYDLHAKKSEKFLAKETTGEVEEQVE